MPRFSSSAAGLRRFDVRRFGAVLDGSADCRPALLAAAEAADAVGGGVVYCPEGLYVSDGHIDEWPDFVSLIGDGWGKTIFRPVGADFRWMFVTRSAASPLIGAEFRDFELDGSQISAGANTKGIHIAHVRNCRWDHLYVHDCGMTGIGPDHPQEYNVISHCLAKGNGRLNDGTQSSGNGIGVGLRGNATDEEPILIFGNFAIDNKRYNIMVESQAGSSSQLSSGARIIGNYCSGGQVGIGDTGSRRTIISGNACTGASVAGIAANEGTFSAGQAGYQGLIHDNECYANTGDGIRLDYSVNPVIGSQTAVLDNECSFNGLRGIHVLSADQDIFDLIVKDNVCRFNVRSGVLFSLTGAATAQLRWSNISDNTCLCNGSGSVASDGDGIRVNMIVNDTTIDDNRCFDRLGVKTQDRGIHLNAAVNGGSIRNNDVRNNQTGGMFIGGAISATTALSGNLGYTPPAAVNVVPGASPWTYVVGEVPEVIQIFGGTVSSVLQGPAGSTIQVAAATDCTLLGEPGDNVVLAYSALPTVRTRKR